MERDGGEASQRQGQVNYLVQVNREGGESPSFLFPLFLLPVLAVQLQKGDVQGKGQDSRYPQHP